MVVQKGLQLAAEWADFVLIQNDVSGHASQICGLAVWIRDCDMGFHLRWSGPCLLLLVKESLQQVEPHAWMYSSDAEH